MQILLFFSGLGALLYAMRLMESSLSTLGAGHLRTALLQSTRNPFMGMLLGTVTTAILQSSSLVGLMTMAFVGAGVLPFRNAIGVILGSNLGTTFTGWLVATVGFKFDLDGYASLLIGMGALIFVSTRENSRWAETGRFVLALGLLLFGLVLMKDSIGFVVDLVDVGSLQNYPVVVYFLVGAVLTAIIQSSSATMMITLAALHAGLLELHAAAALIIGADLGTTSTVIIGSITGTSTKRQIALVHFLFNGVTDILALVCLPLLLELVTGFYGISDPLFALVAIHSSFNLLGIVLFLPLVPQLASLAERLVPLPVERSLLIAQVPPQVPSAAFDALEQDIRMLLHSTILLNGWRLGLLADKQSMRQAELPETPEAAYTRLKSDEYQLSDYLLELQRLELSPEQAGRMHQLLVCIRDCLYSAKAVKDVAGNVLELEKVEGRAIVELLKELLETTEKLYHDSLDLLGSANGINLADLRAMLNRVNGQHQATNVRIYEQIDQGAFKRDQASSALNVNRELLLAGHSLINALEHCLVPGEQARTVSELLSLRH